TFVGRLQALEYIISQNLERSALARIDAITVIPGAVGAWRKRAVSEAGTFSQLTLAEDCDLTLSIHRRGYRILHEPLALAWTEAPESWGPFMRQRFRWLYGTLQAGVRHANAMLLEFRPYALFSLPSILFFGFVLPLVSATVDVAFIAAIVSLVMEFWMHP